MKLLKYHNADICKAQILSDNKNKSGSFTLHPYFITGFADGECCFYISITKNSKLKIG
jgi:hypothetical protein